MSFIVGKRICVFKLANNGQDTRGGSITWDIRTSSIPCTIPSWHLSGLFSLKEIRE